MGKFVKFLRLKSLSVLILIMIASISLLGVVPPAAAYMNTFDMYGGCQEVTSATTCTLGLAGSEPGDNYAYGGCISGNCPPKGSFIVVIVYTDYSNSPVSLSGVVLTQVFSVHTGSSSDGFWMQVFTGLTTGTTNEVITVTSGAYGWGMGYFLYDTPFTHLVGSGNVLSSGANSPEITGVPGLNNALEVTIWSASKALFTTGSSTVSYGSNGAEGLSTNGGVSSCPTFSACGIWELWAFNIGGSYPSSIYGTPGTSMGNQAFSVLIFQTPQAAPPPVVVACSAYNLQCWLYPLFVFGVYMILIGGMAKFAKVPNRDMTGHMLEAFSLAAMLCVLMGILNILVPLLVTVIQVIRALRE